MEASVLSLWRAGAREALRGHDTHCAISCFVLCCAMARLSRIVIPDIPHHVTQRGNRRQKLFAKPGD
jgi:hypothetical protein